MRRALWVSALLLAGCVPAVYVPPTVEGQSCLRECIGIYNGCLVANYGNQWRGLICGRQRHDCLLTCPGAQEQ